MFLKAIIAFLVLPGVAGFVIPAVIIWVDPFRSEVYPIGFVLALCGLIGLGWCVRDFYTAGKGTLAPWAPPQKLVILGLYQFNRNPMYISVLLLVGGIALWWGSLITAIYMVILAMAFHLRVVYYEEPTLEKQFEESWRAYRAEVPRWGMRLRKLSQKAS